MRLKHEIEQENRELKIEIHKLKNNQMPCGQVKDYCPNCGNPILINQGAYNNRRNNGVRTFYCSVGHSFTYRS